MSVEEALMETIQKILHKNVLSTLQTEKLNDNVLTILQTEKPIVYLDMYYDVVKTKMTIATSTSRTVPFRVNYTVLDKLLKTHFGKNLSELSVPIERKRSF